MAPGEISDDATKFPMDKAIIDRFTNPTNPYYSAYQSALLRLIIDYAQELLVEWDSMPTPIGSGEVVDGVQVRQDYHYTHTIKPLQYAKELHEMCKSIRSGAMSSSDRTWVRDFQKAYVVTNDFDHHRLEFMSVYNRMIPHNAGANISSTRRDDMLRALTQHKVALGLDRVVIRANVAAADCKTYIYGIQEKPAGDDDD
jgi:hypothetical protein